MRGSRSCAGLTCHRAAKAAALIAALEFWGACGHYRVDGRAHSSSETLIGFPLRPNSPTTHVLCTSAINRTRVMANAKVTKSGKSPSKPAASKGSPPKSKSPSKKSPPKPTGKAKPKVKLVVDVSDGDLISSSGGDGGSPSACDADGTADQQQQRFAVLESLRVALVGCSMGALQVDGRARVFAAQRFSLRSSSFYRDR